MNSYAVFAATARPSTDVISGKPFNLPDPKSMQRITQHFLFNRHSEGVIRPEYPSTGESRPRKCTQSGSFPLLAISMPQKVGAIRANGRRSLWTNRENVAHREKDFTIDNFCLKSNTQCGHFIQHHIKPHRRTLVESSNQAKVQV